MASCASLLQEGTLFKHFSQLSWLTHGCLFSSCALAAIATWLFASIFRHFSFQPLSPPVCLLLIPTEIAAFLYQHHRCLHRMGKKEQSIYSCVLLRAVG